MSTFEPLEPLSQLSPIPVPAVTPVPETPIITQLPNTQASFARKYSNPDTIKALKRVPKNVRRSIIEMDHDRAQKGQYPLSVKQTANALITAVQHKPVTKKKQSSPFNLLELPGRAISDVRSLVTEIPKLPITLLGEVGKINTIGEEAEKVKSLGDIAQLPGIRLLPGAYTASGLLPGGIPAGELLRHPVMTGLDVAPFAGKLLRTPGGVAARAKVAQSPVGQVVKHGAEELAASSVGQAARRTFGQTARTGMRMTNEKSLWMNREMATNAEIKLGTHTKTIPNPFEAETALGQLKREFDLLEQDANTNGITPQRTAEIKTKLEAADYSGLTEREQLYVSKYRELAERQARAMSEIGTEAETIGASAPSGEKVAVGTPDSEIFDAKTLRKRHAAFVEKQNREVFQNVGRRIGQPLPVEELGTFRQEVTTGLKRQGLKKGQRARAAEGYAHAVDAAGYEATGLFDAVKAYRRGVIDEPTLVSTFDNSLQNPTTRTIPTMDKAALLEAIPKSTDPQLIKLRDAITNERWGQAAQIGKGISRRVKREVPEGILDAVDNFSRQAKRQKYLGKLGDYEKAVERAAKASEKVNARVAPARFIPELTKRAAQEYATRLSDGTPENIAEITRQIVTKDFDSIGGPNRLEFDVLKKEFEGTWQTLKSEGFDPVFVHTVRPGQINSVLYPKVRPTITTPGALKRRTMDWTPEEGSPSIAMTHEAAQGLGRLGSEQLLNQFADWIGETRAELDARLRPRAERKARGNANLVADKLNKMVENEMTPLSEIDSSFRRSKKFTDKFGDEEVYIPKILADNLRDFMKVSKNPITTVIDPVMNVFRTSVLPLSPRWQVWNLMGGIIATAIENPMAFRNIPRAYQIIKEGGEGIANESMRLKLGHSMQLQQDINKPQIIKENNLAAGRTGARLMDSVNVERLNGKVISPAREMFGKAVKWSFDRNEFVDQMFRTMNYLEAERTGLAKGMTAVEAGRLGEEAARKVLADWTELTPVERSVMRYMAPFYSFMQHITRYALRYPMEHPWRTATLGAFARAEEEDFGTGLPQRFLNSFFLGEPDENGNVTSINLAGMNPFRDVADTFTLAGLLGQSNPIIQTLAEQVGVDTMSGGPELYPTLRYDSLTGQLKAQAENPISAFLSNVVPQTDLLRTLMGTNAEFRELARTNPRAARAMLQSQAGLPILTKQVNVPQEEIKNQLRLEENQKKVLSDALRSGDYTEARQYPALVPYLSQVQKLARQGKLKQFQPPSGPTGGLPVARQLIPVP